MSIIRGTILTLSFYALDRIVIHADDADRLLARPVTIAFTPSELASIFSTGKVFLPLISR